MPEYDIFLSHASKDNPQVELMYEDLEELEFSVWFDKDNIHGGNKWTQAIEDGITNSKVLVVYWTESAKDSEWVDKEITWALFKNIPIIPFIRDNSELKITIQNIQYIDARSGYVSAFPKLASRINNYVQAEISSQHSDASSWSSEKEPFFRSKFLEQNNYLDVRSKQFAAHDWTNHLYMDSKKPSNLWVTLVSIPIPNILNVNFKNAQNNIQNYINLSQEHYKKRFSQGYRHKSRRALGEIILQEEDNWGEKNNLRNYLRFDRDGNVEFADGSFETTFDFEKEGGKKYKGFRLIPILGASWKLLNFLAHYYAENAYLDRFQFLVNLRNTENSILDGFARENYRGWDSQLENRSGGWRDKKSGISSNTHLQFIYNVSANDLLQSPSISKEIMLDLNEQVQWAFNLEYKPRHCMTQSDEFHWESYPREWI